MKTPIGTKTLMPIALLSCCALSFGAETVGPSTLCAGAARLNNGSIVSLGQPFVGVMSSTGGTTVNAGIIPALLAATNSPPSPPYISSVTWLPNGSFQFSFFEQAGYNYTVQESTNLLAWISVWTSPGTGSEFVFQDTNATLHSRMFYRVMKW